MLQHTLTKIYFTLKEKFGAWAAQNPYNSAIVALWLCFFCICVSFPSYDLFFIPNEIVSHNWNVLEIQANHPLTPQVYPAQDHAGQIAFRILLPGLAYILHLPIGFYFMLLHIAGWFFFLLTQKVCIKASFSPWEAFLVALGLASTYVGKAFFVDVHGYFDGFAFLLLLLALAYRPKWVAYAAYLAAFFIDERAYLAVPLVAVARLWLYEKNLTYLAFWKNTLPTVLVLLVGLVIRFFLHQQFGLTSGTSSSNLGIETVRTNFKVATIGLLSGLEFWSFATFLPAFYFSKLKYEALGISYFIYLGACFLAMLIVLDLTRCTAYLFPAVFAALFAISRYESPSFREKILVFFTGTSLLFPPLLVVGDVVVWLSPILPKLGRLVAILAFGAHI